MPRNTLMFAAYLVIYLWLVTLISGQDGNSASQDSVVDSANMFSSIPRQKTRPPIDDCKSRQFSLPNIPTNSGFLRGKRVDLDRLCPVVQFLGIPYAEPPTQTRRWKKPRDPLAWDGVKKAFNMGPVCPQKLERPFLYPLLPVWFEDSLPYMKKMSKNMSEDCLYLNIYVPLEFYQNGAPKKYENRLPVMVYIHGHTFMEGSGNFYDGSVLASYGKVIVVTFNYRLGVLGFLSTSNRLSPGNYGLWDQIKALEWISKNIEHFGGDKSRITLFGSGSGAASISLLMMYANVKDYFQRIILQSGTALSSWTIVKQPTKQTEALSQHKLINCSNPSAIKMIDCLRNKDWRTFLKVDLKPELYNLAFGPVVDGVVLADEPSVSMNSGEFLAYPMIIGISQGDGFGLMRKRTGERIGANEFLKQSHDDRSYFQIDLDNFVDGFYQKAGSAKRIISKLVEFMYTDWTKETNSMTLRRSLLDLYTDRQWLEPVVKTAELYCDYKHPVYFYTLSHRAGSKPGTEWMDAGHGDELPFVFGYPFLPNRDSLFGFNFTKTDRMVSAGIMTYWTNFAKEGNPMKGNKQKTDFITGLHNTFQNIQWPPYDQYAQKSLEISKKPVIRDHYRAIQVAFWSTFLPDLLESENILPHRSTTMRPVVAAQPTTRKTTVKSQPWTPLHENSMSPNSIEGSSKAEGGMSLQLTITLAIGFVLLFANIIAFSVVSYHKEKNKYKIERLEAQLEEKNRKFSAEFKKRGLENDNEGNNGNVTEIPCQLDNALDNAMVTMKSDHNVCAYTLPAKFGNTKSPIHTISTATLPPLKPCAYRDDFSSAEEQCRLQRCKSLRKYPNDTYHSSEDGSPASVLVCNIKDELTKVHQQRAYQERKIEMSSGEKGGRYSLQTTNSATPDHTRMYKTLNGKIAIPGSVRMNNLESTDDEANRPSSLWSVVSSVANGRNMYQQFGVDTTSRLITQSNTLLNPSSTLISQGGDSYIYSVHSNSQQDVEENNAPSAAEGNYLARDLSCGSKSALLASPIEKPHFRSDTSGSDTDRTGSSSRSDAVGSYRVTNNKTNNIITKL